MFDSCSIHDIHRTTTRISNGFCSGNSLDGKYHSAATVSPLLLASNAHGAP